MDLVLADKQPRGDVTFEISAAGPGIGAVAWNVSKAPERSGLPR
ncbi:hypothetical protein [Streptomyces sp. KMM 9044]|nr:hypothetical protein [Streptomyces sp. KMM 9044]WAX77200.1 hypothetical protein HUV60_005500 [Streptomyces sp. KMM 9044]